MKRIGVADYKKLIYPAILALIIIITIAAAFLAVKFLTFNINSSFNPDESALKAGMIKIDIENYKLTAEKLGIEYPSTSENSQTEPTLPEEQQ